MPENHSRQAGIPYEDGKSNPKDAVPCRLPLSPPPKVKVGEKVWLNLNGREYIGAAEAIWPPEQ